MKDDERMRPSVTVFVGAMVIIGFSVLAAPVRADVSAAVAGEVFVPFNGQAGPSGLLQVLGSAKQWRFGGEVEYRNYKSSIFDVDDVSFDSICLRGIVQYHFRTEGVQPYLGAGFGLNINSIDSNSVERGRPDLTDVSDVGAGIGLLGLGGVEFPLGDRVSLFGEARVSVDFQLTKQKGGGDDDIGAENLGGVSGIGGIRIRF
jgi:hypothetical protein